MKIKIKKIAYHRNGICGNGFYVVLFRRKERGDRLRNMVATVFEEQSNVAVLDVDETKADLQMVIHGAAIITSRHSERQSSIMRTSERRKMKIIDLPKAIKQRQDDENVEWFRQGFAELAELPEAQADKIVTFIMSYLLLEIKVNLGLIGVPPEIRDDKELFWFSDEVRALFEQSDIGIKITGRSDHGNNNRNRNLFDAVEEDLRS
jgi:hypothetical protein